MVNPLKEIVRRVAFLDVLEQAKEADTFLQTVEDENKKFIYSVGNLARNGSRLMLRLAGDFGAVVSTYYGDSVDPEHLTKYLTIGLAGMTAAYLLDYAVYDRLAPNFLKKNDHK